MGFVFCVGGCVRSWGLEGFGVVWCGLVFVAGVCCGGVLVVSWLVRLCWLLLVVWGCWYMLFVSVAAGVCCWRLLLVGAGGVLFGSLAFACCCCVVGLVVFVVFYWCLLWFTDCDVFFIVAFPVRLTIPYFH